MPFFVDRYLVLCRIKKVSLAKNPNEKLLKVKEAYLSYIIPNIQHIYKKRKRRNLTQECFILSHCAILSLSGFYAGAKNTNGNTYRKFVADFFPSQYDPEKLWRALRNSMIHAYTLISTYILSYEHPEEHFKMMRVRSERTGKLVDLTFLNLENFLIDLEQAVHSYFERVETESDLMTKLCKRYDLAPPAAHISDKEVEALSRKNAFRSD